MGVGGVGLYSLFGIVIPYMAAALLCHRVHLPRLEMGEFTRAVPHSDGLRPTEITPLDQGQFH